MVPFNTFVRNTLLAMVLIFPGVRLMSQVDSSNIGWKISLNTGLFISSNYPASFYNGSEANDNKMSFILNNQYYRNEILSILEASDTFRLHGLPVHMRYNPAMMVGFSFRNNYSENKAWFLQFNQARLKAADRYTLEVDPKPFIATDPDLRTFMIWGEEQRFLFDFGLSREFEISSPMFRPYIDIGVSLSNTVVKANKIFVGEREFSLINIYGNQPYIPNSNLQTFIVDQGGIGFGGFVNAGIKFYVNEYFSIDPTVHIYAATTKLEPYNHLRPHFFFNIKLSANNLFMFSDKHL